MKCENCAYFWKEEDETREHCHWTSRCPGDLPPCEEDYQEEDYDY